MIQRKIYFLSFTTTYIF